MNFLDVVQKLNELAPLHLAESWDNVGVLVEPPNMRPISKLLLTNDLTLAVMDEAESKQVDMILSYHPPIFKALKTITTSHWKERIVGRCLAGGIAVYSPHTSYDAVEGGINDWLIRAFGYGDVSPIFQSYSSGGCTHKVEISREDSDSVSAIRQIIADNFKENVFVKEEEKTVLVLCVEKSLASILTVVATLPFKSRLTISKLEKIPILNHGAGRSMTLTQPMTVEEAVEAVKRHLGLLYVRLAIKHGGKREDLIHSVSVCAGSGVSVLGGVKSDLLLTGEMSHHEVLELAQKGSNVILTEHSNCERGFLSAVLKKKLNEVLSSQVEVIVSEVDRDPLETV